MSLLKNISLENILSVGIWKITESEQELRSLLEKTHPGPLAADSFKNESRRKQWMASRIVLSLLLENSSPETSYNEHGKPLLKNNSHSISLSHSGELAAAAVSLRFPVGIDIEMIRDRVTRVARRFMNEAELSSLNSQDRLEKLHVYWGAKESLYKLGGNPEVDFRKDITIRSFDYFCSPVQTCQASMIRDNIMRVYPVYYEKIGGYMLVFTYDNGMPDDLMT
ncbi:MAG: 4'-phosphopantetheinyl transferase superfamily protein [bacterium]